MIDLESTTDALNKTATVQDRILGSTDEEIDAAVVTVTCALAHPILRRASASFRSGGLRREVPVMLRTDCGSLVEGIVDLAFREDSPDFAGWTVVDFKTDHELEGSSDRYLDQVRWYSTAVREATNLPTRGVLLVI